MRCYLSRQHAGLTRREALALLLAGPLPLTQGAPAGGAPGDPTSFTLAGALAEMRSGRLRPIDLTDAYLARIAAIDPDLNAFVVVTADRARADAARMRPGVLGGIPVAHKDLIETAGIPTRAGSRLFASHVPARDAEVVSRLARAGAVLIGKTNTHELGGGVTTINPFHGTTRNPADRSRIAGGSSGGSAAVVAARLAAAATGSDTGGSVRIPAAFCGVVGFKPTFGRLSTSGLLGACPTFDHVGMIARTPGDAGLLYQVMSGRSPGRSDGGRRRLGVGVARSFFFDRLTAGVARAMDDAVGRFERLGALVEDRDLPVDAGTMARVFDPIVSAEIWARYGDDWRERPDLFSSDFAGFFRVAPPSPGEVVEARRALAVFRRDMGRAMDGIDVVLTPTVPVTAPPIAGPIDAPLILRNTWPFNAARTPAISIPCGTDPDGLPIGLQLAGREGTDEAVLEAARRFTTGT